MEDLADSQKIARLQQNEHKSAAKWRLSLSRAEANLKYCVGATLCRADWCSDIDASDTRVVIDSHIKGSVFIIIWTHFV